MAAVTQDILSEENKEIKSDIENRTKNNECIKNEINMETKDLKLNMETCDKNMDKNMDKTMEKNDYNNKLEIFEEKEYIKGKAEFFEFPEKSIDEKMENSLYGNQNVTPDYCKSSSTPDYCVGEFDGCVAENKDCVGENNDRVGEFRGVSAPNKSSGGCVAEFGGNLDPNKSLGGCVAENKDCVAEFGGCVGENDCVGEFGGNSDPNKSLGGCVAENKDCVAEFRGTSDPNKSLGGCVAENKDCVAEFGGCVGEFGGNSDPGKNWGGCVGEEGADSDWDWERGRPRGERWPPLGAPNDEEDNLSLCSYSELSWQRSGYGVGYRASIGSGGVEEERLQQLEEEQEQLNNSLMALTSHFAQVQFRLKQIVDAGPSEKEELLQQLEEFANRGIPDLRDVSISRNSNTQQDTEQECTGGVDRQKELISKLKQQLEDLEDYVYKSGQGGPPQASVMEKQRVIIEQLKGKLNLNVDEFDKLTVDDLRVQVDHAIRELINPLKMKEQLVAQLQTQITDLERFIDFLQGEGPNIGLAKSTDDPCKCDPRRPGDGRATRDSSRDKAAHRTTPKDPRDSARDTEQLRQETENLVKRAATLMKMLSFGCGGGARFRSNTLKKTPRGNHYGDLRARLEVGINSVLEVLQSLPCEDTEESSGSDSNIVHQHPHVTTTVRKALAPPLRDLIQHGLMPVGQSQSLVPFLSCFPHRDGGSNMNTQLLHAWDLILQYYHLHHGHRYNHTPARSLSQSFNLEITGGVAVTNKQSLLAAVGSIISTHTPLKRSYDAHFKAFVSAALNQKKLITWLRLIFRTQSLTEKYYQPWSYVSLTGFDDAFRSLDRLSRYNFQLPTDLAIRPFNNIKDAF